ncbi:DUF2637 domain-containing protein [Streptomyces sp. NPDC052693]|uniref:DUF2637 domain-containing protein n=1 Tax=Streptomyces sp. NPDC052693 TaxID=3155814 RepID=UPI00343CA943
MKSPTTHTTPRTDTGPAHDAAPTSPPRRPHRQHTHKNHTPPNATTGAPHHSQAQRRLITTVTTGAVIIAAIGFAGSYTAVQQLALDKGFGTFSYLFPIGIDAGICITLALDLLLTWIHIPFPLLRHTAWLLTTATIAFNAAAAWPDPLGVAMHAVIPLLFVVTVEAARHAIGRIADITANTHIEPIRPTRWLLAPARTFLLWRRMKLWELRSYQHVIKLEQERLIYQTRLRIQYGRRWRRKAPTQTLIPLKLARYGIPLPRPEPPSSAAANSGINTPQQPLGPAPHKTPTLAPSINAPHSTTTTEAVTTAPNPSEMHPIQFRAESSDARISMHEGHGKHPKLSDGLPAHTSGLPNRTAQHTQHGDQTESTRKTIEATPRQSPERTKNDRRTPTTPDLDKDRPAHRSTRPHRQSHHRDKPAPQRFEQQLTTKSATGSKQSETIPNGAADAPPAQPDPTAHRPTSLSKVDHYYLAWVSYQKEHGTEPTGQQLALYLAAKGLHGQNERPISPATLRRYLLSYRIYTVWAEHRAHSPHPSPAQIIRECTTRGITAQYNTPITAHHITKNAVHFERRWRTLHTQHPRKTPSTDLPASRPQSDQIDTAVATDHAVNMPSKTRSHPSEN